MGQWETHLKDQALTNMVPTWDDTNVLERRNHELRMLRKESFPSFRHKGVTVIQAGQTPSCAGQNSVSSHTMLVSRISLMHVPRF